MLIYVTFFFNSMFMKVPVDERHNTISNTRVLHEDARADAMYMY